MLLARGPGAPVLGSDQSRWDSRGGVKNFSIVTCLVWLNANAAGPCGKPPKAPAFGSDQHYSFGEGSDTRMIKILPFETVTYRWTFSKLLGTQHTVEHEREYHRQQVNCRGFGLRDIRTGATRPPNIPASMALRGPSNI
jgi:hypothetical protein